MFSKNKLENVIVAYDDKKKCPVFFGSKKGKLGRRSLGDIICFESSDLLRINNVLDFVIFVHFLLNISSGLHAKEFYCSSAGYENAYLFYK